MRDPGILDPRHFFFPRHFYTIYAIFTQFYAIFTQFYTIYVIFTRFYAICTRFYANFAIFPLFFARHKMSDPRHLKLLCRPRASPLGPDRITVSLTVKARFFLRFPLEGSELVRKTLAMSLFLILAASVNCFPLIHSVARLDRKNVYSGRDHMNNCHVRNAQKSTLINLTWRRQ